MDSAAWIKLINLLPAQRHDQLMVMTKIGQELSIQSILRIEDNYLVVRGRQGGTTDEGRIFFVPYETMIFLGLTKPLKEPEVHAIFGESPPQAVPAPGGPAGPVPLADSSQKLESQPIQAAPGSQPPEGQPPVAAIGRSSGRHSKKALLDRIRQRAQQAAAGRNGE